MAEVNNGALAGIELEHKPTNDVLFKILFKDHRNLLKCLVTALLGLRLESIGKFEVKNPDMPSDAIGDKFCRFDIAMEVDGRLVDLEVQVANERNYRERSLFNWARLFSGGLPSGKDYIELPPSIVISILAFSMFDCAEFHSEFSALEVTRHELLTDKMALHYFELPKLPEVVDGNDGLKLWLAFFNAKTESDLIKLKDIGGTIMAQAVEAYHRVSTSSEFKELERLRVLARVDEMYALAGAERKGKTEVARRMKADGADIATIIKYTDLTVDDILRL